MTFKELKKKMNVPLWVIDAVDLDWDELLEADSEENFSCAQEDILITIDVWTKYLRRMREALQGLSYADIEED